MLKVLEDRVIIEVIEPEQVTASGFIIAGHQERSQEAIVVAVNEFYTSPSGKQIPMDIKVGDKVLFAKYSGTELEYEKKKYIMIQYRDIIATLEEN